MPARISKFVFLFFRVLLAAAAAVLAASAGARSSCERDFNPQHPFLRFVGPRNMEIEFRLNENGRRITEIWIGSTNLFLSQDQEPQRLLHLHVRNSRFLPERGGWLGFADTHPLRTENPFAIYAKVDGVTAAQLKRLRGIDVRVAGPYGILSVSAWRTRAQFHRVESTLDVSPVKGPEAEEILRIFGDDALEFRGLSLEGPELSLTGVQTHIQMAHLLRGLRQRGLRADHPIFSRL